MKTAGLIAAFAAGAYGCTSFVDYSSGSPWYGMNFDWHPDQEILFRLETDDRNRPVFTMSFVAGGSPVPTAGFTEDGRFSSMQVVDAPWTGPSEDREAPFIFVPFYALTYDSASPDDLAGMAAGGDFRQHPDPPLHIIAADPSGKVIILEVGESGNMVLDLSASPAAVMTNFSNCDWAGVHPDSIRGAGADRYRAALGEMARVEGVDCPEAGMAVLQAAVNTSEGFPTRASMVFDPGQGKVYLAVAGDFGTVWSLDLSTGDLCRWNGSQGETVTTVDSAGVTASMLRSF